MATPVALRFLFYVLLRHRALRIARIAEPDPADVPAAQPNRRLVGRPLRNARPAAPRALVRRAEATVA
jgi:hypothetical protein